MAHPTSRTAPSSGYPARTGRTGRGDGPRPRGAVVDTVAVTAFVKARIGTEVRDDPPRSEVTTVLTTDIKARLG